MRVSKWGNGLGVRLPAVEALGLREGDEITIDVAGPLHFRVARDGRRDEALETLRILGWTLPSDYAFSRDEANQRDQENNIATVGKVSERTSGLSVDGLSQKMTAICIVDSSDRRLWRDQCPTDPEQIRRVVTRHGGEDVRVGLETGPMTPSLVHELRGFGLDITCLDAKHARAALRMQLNKTDQNDAEGLAQIRTPLGMPSYEGIVASSSGSVSSIIAGDSAYTPTHTNALLLAPIVANGAGSTTFIPDSGFTNPDQYPPVSGQNAGGSQGYKVAPSPTATNVTWTLSPAADAGVGATLIGVAP